MNKERQVLIVSPRFPPINAPDHQRVRMALPLLEEFGWRATVLAVRPEFIEGGEREPLLEKAFPAGLPIERVRAFSPRLTRLVGIGSLSFRAWHFLAAAGKRLLSREKYDLVLFSTTEFPLMALGPRWLRQHGIPYALDIQDPWVNDYYEQHPEARPPGGKIKYGLSQWLARRMESNVIRQAAHVVCVSPSYPEMFMNRYPGMKPDAFSEIPFGAALADFESVRDALVEQSCFKPQSGKLNWVYVGVVSSSMLVTVRAFFMALNRALNQTPNLRKSLRIHFIGTDYSPRHLARNKVMPLAKELGVDDMVTERTQRVPYFQALRCLCDADALIIPGSDDPGYTASKLYPYILARKPLLAIFHEKSSVADVLRRTQAGTVITFNSSQDSAKLSEAIYRMWFERWPVPTPQTDWQAFEPYTAREMTRRLCQVFDRAVTKGPLAIQKPI